MKNDKTVKEWQRLINDAITQRNVAEARYEEMKHKTASMVECYGMRVAGVCRDLERAGQELRIRRQMDVLYRELLKVYREPETLMIGASDLKEQIQRAAMEAFERELYGAPRASLASLPDDSGNTKERKTKP